MPIVRFGDPLDAVTIGGMTTADDGQVHKIATDYPPTSAVSRSMTSNTTQVTRSFVSPNYTVRTMLLRWNTSAIPDTATITGAWLEFYVTGRGSSDTETMSLVAGWRVWDGTDTDYISTPQTNAHLGTAITTLTPSAVNTISLDNLININKTGVTNLQLWISQKAGDTAPTASNSVTIATMENTSQEPRLVVEYTEGASDTTSPSIPSTLTASGVTIGQIDLSWIASTDNVGVSQYRIERSTTASAGFAEIGTSTTNTYIDKSATLVNNTTYYYRVRAQDAAGNLSGYSNEASAIFTAPPYTKVQQKANHITSATAATTLSVTMDTPATAGNILYTVLPIDKGGLSGAPIPPTGFTLGPWTTGGDAAQGSSIATAWKKAVGGEQTFTWTLAGTDSRIIGVYVAEWSGISNPTLDVSASDNSGLTARTSQPSGTTSASTKSGLALGAISWESSSTFSRPINFNNDYILQYDWEADDVGGNGGNPTIHIASKPITSGVQATTTATQSNATGDQSCGTIAVFVAGDGGGEATPSVTTDTPRSSPITNTSVKLAVNTSGIATGTITAVLDTVNTLNSGSRQISGSLTRNDAGAIQVEFTGLTAGTQYYYGFYENTILLSGSTGKIKTLAQNSSHKIILSSCSATDYNGVSYTNAATENADFIVHDGDLHYLNRTYATDAAVVTDYNRFGRLSNFQALLANCGLCYKYDDHDGSGGNDTNGTKAGWQHVDNMLPAWWPTPALGRSPNTGAYRTLRVGNYIQYYFLDERRFRSAQSLADDANKTMLGTDQKAQFKADMIAARDAGIAIHVFVHNGPWVTATVANVDDWGGYNVERQELVTFFTNNQINNRIHIAGDMHAGAVDIGNSPNNPDGSLMLHGAPWGQNSSKKGGPYYITDGVDTIYPSTGGIANTQQYSVIEFVNNNDNTITVIYSLKQATDNTTPLTYSRNYNISSVSSLNLTYSSMYTLSNLFKALFSISSSINNSYSLNLQNITIFSRLLNYTQSHSTVVNNDSLFNRILSFSNVSITNILNGNLINVLLSYNNLNSFLIQKRISNIVNIVNSQNIDLRRLFGKIIPISNLYNIENLKTINRFITLLFSNSHTMIVDPFNSKFVNLFIQNEGILDIKKIMKKTFNVSSHISEILIIKNLNKLINFSDISNHIISFRGNLSLLLYSSNSSSANIRLSVSKIFNAISNTVPILSTVMNLREKMRKMVKKIGI